MANANETATAHTPGPWYADLVDLVIYSKPSDEATKIAVVHQQVEPSEDSDITSANALVLAAAPDLLEACEVMLYWYEEILPRDEIADGGEAQYLRDAIAKAKGKPLGRWPVLLRRVYLEDGKMTRSEQDD